MAETISTYCKPQGIRTARKDYTFLPPPHSQLTQFSYTKTVTSTSRQDAPRDADFSAHIRRTETASDGIPIPRNITYPRQSAVIIRALQYLPYTPRTASHHRNMHQTLRGKPPHHRNILPTPRDKTHQCRTSRQSAAGLCGAARCSGRRTVYRRGKRRRKGAEPWVFRGKK